MDIPEQGLRDIKVTGIEFINDSITISLSQFQAKYSGRLTSDSVIAGRWQQGVSIPLALRKVTAVSEKVRPQTPVPPFPYKEEILTYTNKDGSITFGATLTIPEGKGPFAAVLLLTGSGQQNRDEEIMGHKPFAVIADHLARNGFVVLRVDDRGVGQTTGDVFAATTRDFADDATIGIDYLKRRKEVNKKKIGLIGHSEGAMIAQLLGAERDDIHFMVFLAGPGVQIRKVMHEQNEAILLKAGMGKSYVNGYLDLYDQLVAAIVLPDTSTLKARLSSIVDKWVTTTPRDMVAATTAIKDEASKQRFIEQFVSLGSRPWFRYFLNYDPEKYLKKISAHVLAINGSKDLQIISKTNVAGLQTAFKQGRAKSFRVMEAEGLNHLFQRCKLCSLNEYGQLDETFNREILSQITDWLRKL
jgi:uncharacterized protein